jgi:antitoxin component YwqK of YwqJK toxin-antitoxin module
MGINFQKFNSMRIYVAVLVLTGILISCNSSKDPAYPNYNKWHIDGWSPVPLRGSPKEIIETLYNQLDDTASFQPPARFLDVRTYRFDEDGNLIFMRSQLDSSYITEIHTNYQMEGVRKRIYSFDKVGGDPVNTNEEIAEKIGKDKYKLTSSNKNLIMSYDKIETYFNDGAGLTVEYVKDGTNYGAITYEHKNDRLEYLKKMRDKDTTESFYHYSSNGFLDSVTAKKDGAWLQVKVYINNEHGDPVEIIDEGKSTRFKYEYDAKGNWVKRLLYEPEPSKMLNLDSKFPNYSLMIREIKY